VAGLAEQAARAGNQNAVSDAAVGAMLAATAARGACFNVEVNVAAMSDSSAGEPLREEARRLAGRAEDFARAAGARVSQVISG